MDTRDTTHHAGKRFSKAADTYDQHSGLQHAIALELIEILAELTVPHHILDAGCGTGFLTEQLATAYPTAQIDAVDLAADMIRVAQAKMPEAHNVEWIVSDLRDYQAPMHYDIIASSSALQWLTPLDLSLQHLASMLKPGGYLIFSAMTRDTLHELHATRREVAPDKSPPLQLPAFGDFLEALQTAPIRMLHDHHATYTRTYPSANALLRTLNQQGVTGGAVSRGRQPLSRGELTKLKSLYEQRYADESGGVRCTYEVGFFVAQTSESR